jgi:hypothetical protein
MSRPLKCRKDVAEDESTAIDPSKLPRGITSAVSSSLASIAGAVAATAEAPQIELSTAMSIGKFPSNPNQCPKTLNTIKPNTITPKPTANIFRPAWAINCKSSLTPSRMIPARSNVLAEKPMPRC